MLPVAAATDMRDDFKAGAANNNLSFIFDAQLKYQHT
jgi:hypothetical protein